MSSIVRHFDVNHVARPSAVAGYADIRRMENFILLFTALFYQPSFHTPFCLRKFYAYFNCFSVVGGIGDRVILTVNLFQGIFGSGIAVHFEFENVDIAGSFYDGVCSAFVAFYFGLRKLPQ
jgi:hypothetical protein